MRMSPSASVHFIANTLIASFAAGRGSALVIDVGHSMASVTPVVDGFVLRKGIWLDKSLCESKLKGMNIGLVYSTLPRLVHAHARHILTTPNQHRRGIDLIPHQLISNKTVSALRISLVTRPILLLSLWSRAHLLNSPPVKIVFRKLQLVGERGQKVGKLTNGYKQSLVSSTKDGMISMCTFIPNPSNLIAFVQKACCDSFSQTIRIPIWF